MKHETKKTNRGFTLVELIVVMAVFLFIISTAIAIFISIVQHQRKILREQEFLNQTSYVIEYMSKALRMAGKDTTGDCLDIDYLGYNYLLTRPDLSGFYKGIKFINESDNSVCQEFFLDNTTDPFNPVLKEKKNKVADEFAVSLTSSNLQINSVRFGINGTNGCYGGGSNCPEGAPGNDLVQPRITIFLDIEFKGAEGEIAKKIQTTVSQRNLNVE